MGLIESIKDFVSEEIMSEKNIEDTLVKIKPVKIILTHIKNEEKNANGIINSEGLIKIFAKFTGKLTSEILLKMDIKKLFGPIVDSLDIHFQNYPPSGYIISFLNKLGESDNFERLINSSAIELTGIFKLKSISSLMESGIDFAIKNYKNDMKRRNLIANQLGNILKKSMIENAELKLRSYTELNSKEMSTLKESYLEAVEKFATDVDYKSSIDMKFISYLKESDILSSKLEEIFGVFKDESFHLETKISGVFEKFITFIIEEVSANNELREKIEIILIDKIVGYANDYKEKIRQLVEINLTSMSEKELFYYLRDNTAAELQYIRLNGMLFGTIIGVFVTIIRIYLEVIR